MKRRIPQKGDVYWINPNPTSGHEIKNRHRFVVITSKEINRLGVATVVPITSGGRFIREIGLAVSIFGFDTVGAAICNQMRSYDLESRVKAGSAEYIETLDETTVNEIILKVVSIIDLEEE